MGPPETMIVSSVTAIPVKLRSRPDKVTRKAPPTKGVPVMLPPESMLRPYGRLPAIGVTTKPEGAFSIVMRSR